MTVYIRDGRAPVPAKEATSKMMQANRAKNTKPEVLFRKALWKAGFRGYRLHPKQLPGRPDIFFGKYKLAIFINGCFWHRCPKCNLQMPKSHTQFWKVKFKANVARDKKKIKALKDIGSKTITIWECDIKANIAACLKLVEKAIGKIRIEKSNIVNKQLFTYY